MKFARITTFLGHQFRSCLARRMLIYNCLQKVKFHKCTDRHVVQMLYGLPKFEASRSQLYVTDNRIMIQAIVNNQMKALTARTVFA